MGLKLVDPLEGKGYEKLSALPQRQCLGDVAGAGDDATAAPG